jgi:hypothetical protein
MSVKAQADVSRRPQIHRIDQEVCLAVAVIDELHSPG